MNACYNINEEENLKSYSSKEIIRILIEDGWYLLNVRGDHHQYKHPFKKGKVTVTHPKKDIPTGTVKSIFKVSGINLKEGKK